MVPCTRSRGCRHQRQSRYPAETTASDSPKEGTKFAWRFPCRRRAVRGDGRLRWAGLEVYGRQIDVAKREQVKAHGQQRRENTIAVSTS